MTLLPEIQMMPQKRMKTVNHINLSMRYSMPKIDLYVLEQTVKRSNAKNVKQHLII